MKPHSLFSVWSPDEVAECLEGIGNSPVYARLWELVRHYSGKPRSEVPDDFDDRALKNWWHELSLEDQQFLNKKAEEQDHAFNAH